MFIAGFVIFSILIALSYLLPKFIEEIREEAPKLPIILRITAACIVVPTTIFSCFTTIPAGCRGVPTLFGEVQPLVIEEGLHPVNPFYNIIVMNTQVQKDTEKQIAETSDTQSVTVGVITNWQPIASELNTIYKNYGLDYDKKIIPPAIQEAVKSEVAKYKVTELIARRPELHQGVQSKVNAWLNKYNLQVLEITISDIDFSDKYDSAIEAKQVQEQQALQKQYELQKTETEAKMAAAAAKGEAESKIARATGDAESVKLAAQAEAEALRIKGDAQADYNKKVAESINSILIQSEWLKKWDGKLPVYVLGDKSNSMLMLPTYGK